MDDETGPKSAYEVVMARLRKQDEEAGIERPVVTDDQKAAIAEVRSMYEAKLAQLQVLYEGQLGSTLEPGEREVLEDQYRRDRERLASERDAKVAKARGASQP